MITQISTKNVYVNNWMRVREDQVEFENGHQGIYGVVEKDDFALIIPLEEGYFHLVRQYRYPIKGYSWEFPQGKHENNPEMVPSELAKQELEEETGLIANEVTEIGFLHEAAGYSNQGFHIFLAEKFLVGEQKLEESEVGLESKKISIKDFEEMVISGDIKDAPTLSAYALLKVKKII